MQLIPLNDEAQLSRVASTNNCVVILKHNTSCSISQGVVDRLQAYDETVKGIDGIYIIDHLNNRELSKTVAGRFGIPHQSPQVLVIKNGRCAYHEWGFDISAAVLKNVVEQA